MASPSTPPAPGPQKKPTDEKLSPPREDDDAPGANDDDVMEIYNQHHEFHIAVGLSGLFHVMIAVGLVLLASIGAGADDKASPPLSAVDVTDIPDMDPGAERDMGRDLSGRGSAGSGGDLLADDNPDFSPTADPVKTELPDPTQTLPNLNEPPVPTPDPKIDPKASNVRRGTGPNEGRGNTGQAGRGPGGDGTDSTRARARRWSILFNTREGQYFKELHAVGAQLFVPVPGQPEKYYYFPNIGNPGPLREATTEEILAIKDRLRFTDTSPESAREAQAQLRLPFTPPYFRAIFPKKFEEELAGQEQQEVANKFPGKSPAELTQEKAKIKTTVFRVRVHSGLYYVSLKEIKW